MQVACPRWDIFCKVVDNYGDIGVCWRLCQQLALEHGLSVRLWVDELATFQRINTSIDPAMDVQACGDVEIRRWSDPFPAITPGDVVVETFGCEVPNGFQFAMAEKKQKPVWINLEHLSAEAWINDCHTLPSPHPRLPLTKYYFFPGFVPGTGGLLREQGLIARRDAFIGDSVAVNAFWQSLALSSPLEGEIRVSLFSYENPALPDLFAVWAMGTVPMLCLVPEGMAAVAAQAFFTADEALSPQEYRRGNLGVRILPFLQQPDYDRLLWVCDCNFVRGEDSFVRAQWAAKPFAWHIYPQDENAHLLKLGAFIDRYCAEMEPESAGALKAFWAAWNGGDGADQAWLNFWQQWPSLKTQAIAWAERLKEPGELAANLVQFCHEKLLESPVF